LRQLLVEILKKTDFCQDGLHIARTAMRKVAKQYEDCPEIELALLHR
jgi:hypothetical protein